MRYFCTEGWGLLSHLSRPPRQRPARRIWIGWDRGWADAYKGLCPCEGEHSIERVDLPSTYPHLTVLLGRATPHHSVLRLKALAETPSNSRPCHLHIHHHGKRLGQEQQFTEQGIGVYCLVRSGRYMLTRQSKGSQNGSSSQQGKDAVSPFNLPAPTPGGLSPPPYHKRKK
ncbi:hypothetical protein PENSPDRAFT_35241 [Peniophora sp. CONT]|nr:hypothetical protein PENSPDRAFT_35241 [Peniophora sp. CONT]